MEKHNDGAIGFEEFRAAVFGENAGHSNYQVSESAQYYGTLHAAFGEHVDWAANKSLEVLKFKFKFPRARTFELFRARSRLYRSKQASKQVRSVPSKKKEKGHRQTTRN